MSRLLTLFAVIVKWDGFRPPGRAVVWPLAVLLLLLPGDAPGQDRPPPGFVPAATVLKYRLKRSLTPEELALCRAEDEKTLAAWAAQQPPKPPPAPKPPSPCPAWFGRLDPQARAAHERCSGPVAEQLELFAQGPHLKGFGSQAAVFFRLVGEHGDPCARYLMDRAWRLRDDAVAWEGLSADPGRYFASAPKPDAAPPAAFERPPAMAGPGVAGRLAALPWWGWGLGMAGLLVLLRPRKPRTPDPL